MWKEKLDSPILRRATPIAAAVGRAIAFVFILTGVWQTLVGQPGNEALADRLLDLGAEGVDNGVVRGGRCVSGICSLLRCSCRSH